MSSAPTSTAAGTGDATTYRLFVGGVPETITSAELAQRFSRFGEVVEVQLAPPLAGSEAAAPAGAASASDLHVHSLHMKRNLSHSMRSVSLLALL